MEWHQSGRGGWVGVCPPWAALPHTGQDCSTGGLGARVVAGLRERDFKSQDIERYFSDVGYDLPALSLRRWVTDLDSPGAYVRCQPKKSGSPPILPREPSQIQWRGDHSVCGEQVPAWFALDTLHKAKARPDLSFLQQICFQKVPVFKKRSGH